MCTCVSTRLGVCVYMCFKCQAFVVLGCPRRMECGTDQSSTPSTCLPLPMPASPSLTVAAWKTSLSPGWLYRLISLCLSYVMFPPTSLFEMPPGLLHLPALCVQCCLHAVHPPKVRYQHHVTPTMWSSNATHIFDQLVGNKSLKMKVLYVHVQ